MHVEMRLNNKSNWMKGERRDDVIALLMNNPKIIEIIRCEL